MEESSSRPELSFRRDVLGGRTATAPWENEIGGGNKDCETCPDGLAPNEEKTECLSPFTVARCDRSIQPEYYGRYLPAQHPNVLTEKWKDNVVVESIQRGFFPAAGYEKQAAANAALFLLTLAPGSPRPDPIYVPLMCTKTLYKEHAGMREQHRPCRGQRVSCRRSVTMRSMTGC